MATDRRTWFKAQKEVAEVLWRRGATSEQIEGALTGMVREGDREPPSQRTIQRWISEWGGDVEAEEHWTIGSLDDPDDERLVLECLRASNVPEGKPYDFVWDSWPSVEDARMMVAIRRAVPDAPISRIVRWAYWYTSARRRGRDTTTWDVALVLRPWQSREAYEHWYQVLKLMGKRPSPAAQFEMSYQEYEFTREGERSHLGLPDDFWVVLNTLGLERDDTDPDDTEGDRSDD